MSVKKSVARPRGWPKKLWSAWAAVRGGWSSRLDMSLSSIIAGDFQIPRGFQGRSLCLELLQFFHDGVDALAHVEGGEALLLDGGRQDSRQERVLQVLAVGHPDFAIGEFHLGDETGHLLNADGLAAGGETERGILTDSGSRAGRERETGIGGWHGAGHVVVTRGVGEHPTEFDVPDGLAGAVANVDHRRAGFIAGNQQRTLTGLDRRIGEPQKRE